MSPPRGEIPPMSYFEGDRPAAGARTVGLDLGPLGIEIGGLDDRLAEGLVARCAPYSGTASRDPGALRVSLRLDDRDFYIEPPGAPEPNPVLLAFDAGRVRLAGYELAGWFDTLGGRGEILLARGTYEPDLRSIENYLRAAVAWQAASRGGALVHAASAVWRGRGYLFYGPSGAGKSTLARSSRRGMVLSDDLSLVLPDSAGKLVLVGTPFRGTFEGGAPVVAPFPLAAGFRLVQAASAEVRAVPKVRALTELVASLPFVAEAAGTESGLLGRIEASFEGVPLAHLHFRPDDSFWDAIAAAGLAAAR